MDHFFQDNLRADHVKLKAALKVSRNANELLRTRSRALEIASEKGLITKTVKEDPLEKYTN